MEQSPKSILPLYYKLTRQENDMYKLKSKLSPDTGCTGAVFLHVPADRAVRTKYCLLQEPSFITVGSREIIACIPAAWLLFPPLYSPGPKPTVGGTFTNQLAQSRQTPYTCPWANLILCILLCPSLTFFSWVTLDLYQADN